MAIVFTKEMQEVWNHLIGAGMTRAGASGVMGNLYAESGIKSVCLELLCIKRYKERKGIAYTNESYQIAVDSGKISRSEFLNPMGLNYGWGLAQWTSPGRKAGLYDLCKQRGVSIGDLAAQLDFLVLELKQSFSGVWKVATTTGDLRTASDRVLIDFESPADTGSAVRETRYSYSREFYNHYKNTGGDPAPAPVSGMTKAQAIKKVLDIAAGEIGYLEKASNAYLDDKTANAGSNNYTKYWRDVYPQYQAQAWCACFVSWCFMKAFGQVDASRLLRHWPFVYCPTLAGYTANKVPQVGSVVLFYRGGDYAHTGIVEAVNGGMITTIEGNTSGASGIVPNGGGVCRKTYQISGLSPYTKYFIPDWSIVATSSGGDQPDPQPPQDDTPGSGAPSEEPKWVGKVTASLLNVRTWAGTEYPNIKKYPMLARGNLVDVCDTVNDVHGSPWYFVRIAGQWFGFVSARYIEKQ